MMNQNFKFAQPGTLLFLNGSPLSGKSSIAPMVAANISGCMTQSVDIFRLVAQEMDQILPKEDQNPLLNYGSCDSYMGIGDGSYSEEALIDGYRQHSRAICRILKLILPKLEAQGAQNILFEGVQILPEEVVDYLVDNNRFIVVTSDEEQFTNNRNKLFQGEADQKLLEDRYSIDKLMAIQKEIVSQADRLDDSKVINVSNTKTCASAVESIIKFLQSTGTIIELT